jgi:16S rRNA processing protein RimM
MTKEECFLLGHISKVHGFNGEVIFLTKEEYQIDLNEVESVFIEINGQLIPFFIDDCRKTGNTSSIVKLHDVDAVEKAKQLLKSDICLPLSLLSEKNKTVLQPAMLNGYKVIDDEKGDIGEVAKVLEMPQQLILEIRFNKKEILIPANEDIIYKIDHKKKIIYLNAPEGLIDIYLEG